MDKPMEPIPVSAAKAISLEYGYDQVIVIARRVGEAPAPHGEHVTTYGRNPDHCRTAAWVGNFLKHKVMGWPEYELKQPAPSNQVMAERAAIRMLIDAGFVSEAKANEALQIAHGFRNGPMYANADLATAPQPAAVDAKLIGQLELARNRLDADGDEHGVCGTLGNAIAALRGGSNPQDQA